MTQFHDPAVEFALTFQADAPPELREEHEPAENDPPEGEAAEGAAAEKPDDGSNVVSVDFTRKK